MQYSYGDAINKIKFAEIIGQYSFTTSADDVYTSNVMKLKEIAPNAVQGYYPYLYGYYDENTSTLTGIWSSVSHPEAYIESSCVSGGFRFKFYRKNGEIGFSGTSRCGDNEFGYYDDINYWEGTQI